MKRVLLFALVMCFMISSQAQTEIRKPSDSQLISRLKKVELLNRHEQNYTQQLDSMVSVEMMSTYVFQYDEHYNVATLTGTGLLNMNEEFFYDDQDRVICVILTYYGILWSKTEYTYDNHGWLAEEVVYDYNNNGWVYDLRTVYGYEDTGRLLSTHTFKYQQYSGDWNDHEKVEYTYENGNPTLAIQYKWDSNSYIWKFDKKSEYTFNVFNYCTEQYDYTFGAENWLHERYYTYTYDDYFNCEYQMEYVYDYDSGTQQFGWYVDRQIHFYYDMTAHIDNIAGLHFLEEGYTGLDFVNGGVANINYKLVRVEESTFDGAEIDRTFVTDLYYSGLTAVDEVHGSQLNLWPNPTTETLNLSAEDLQQVEIFSMDGRQVMHLENGLENINVSSLAKGCYLLKASFVDGSKTVQKFVKE